MSDSLQPHGLYSPWNSPGHNTGMGSLSLLQGIFPTHGSNPGLPHCRQILYQLSHKRSPKILEWVTYPFFRGSSQPRNQTRVSCIAGGFFTNWTIRKPKEKVLNHKSIWVLVKNLLRGNLLGVGDGLESSCIFCIVQPKSLLVLLPPRTIPLVKNIN